MPIKVGDKLLLLLALTTRAAGGVHPCPDARRLHNGICLPAAWPPRRNISRHPPVAPYLVEPPDAIDISVGRQLFVDAGFLVQRSSGLAQTFHVPTMHPANPVLQPTQPWEQNAGPYGGGIWYDDSDGLIKVWYGCGGGGFGSFNLCLATSADGVVFDKAALKGARRPGTNVVHGPVAADGMMVWLDHDPPSPARRWVMSEVRKSPQYPADAQHLYSSADGIDWRYQVHDVIITLPRNDVIITLPHDDVIINLPH